MKRFLFILLFGNIVLVQHLLAAKSVWDGKSSDAGWYDENASEYHICSAAQFKGFADLVSYNNCTFDGKTVYLDCDIDLDNHYWSPIGLHSGKPFSGVFDGLNHCITNLLIDTNQFEYPDMKDNIGLFGYANKATIKKVSIQGKMEIYGYGKYIGGIAASANRIEDVYSDMKIVLHDSKSSSYIGTIAGSVEDAIRVYCKGGIECEQNYIGLHASCYVGGFAGRCTNLSECLSDVEISVNIIGTSSEHIGGLSGASGFMSNVIFTGSISIGNYNCYNDMFIPNVGGVCGGLTNGDHLISAPDYMSYGRGFATAKSVVVPSNSNSTVTQTYYVNTWATNNEVYGVAISEQNLKSGNPLSEFDTTIWEFKENEYPSLISLKELIPKPTYTVSYYVDGMLYQVDEYKEGEAVIPPADPIKEGYTFSGWDYVPPFISGNSWIVNGSFSINSYVITYMIDEEIYKTSSQEYNSYIYPPTAFPLKQGYLFKWGEYPERVPAHDITIVGDYVEDTYEFVDLGLPSGVLWATKNVGASSPEDYGYYFSWGETIIKESNYWGTYSYCNGSATTLTKYCISSEYGDVDNKYTLDEEDDAVTTNWGKPWRLPTEEDALELYNNCTWSLGSLNGIGGCYVTGPNGNSIFLPKAGYKQYKTIFKKGSELYLMLSKLYTNTEMRSDYGLLIYCDDSSYGLAGEERSFGFSARAVTNTNPSGVKSVTLNYDNDIEGVYDMHGRKTMHIGNGLNIIKYKNGVTKKVVK